MMTFWRDLNSAELLIWLAPLLVLGAVVWAGIGALRRWLLQNQILDVPNARSLHETPTPRGAGLVMLVGVAASWLFLLMRADAPVWDFAVLAAAVGVAALSWLDDRNHIPFHWRLLAHGIAAAIAVFSLPPDVLVFAGALPLWLEHALMVIGLVWFMNLFNFMDGIDGMTGSLIATIAAGITLTTPIWQDWQLAAVLVPVAIAFLIWNWQPAKIFMGDVGSVTFGFLIGWLLLRLAVSGNVVAALILPLYPAMDATVTLVRRIANREKIWEAHRGHFFQKIVRAGATHRRVMMKIILLQVVLIALAVFSPIRPLLSLAIAGVTVTAWLCFCQWKFKHSAVL